ncbi:gamma-glutamylcyclotransferase [Paracoccus thiocyanatus]|uniref:glutathione-specific gamma-glutamylcyclotransferase n=1 Tax=Paracoccus thiocyanatus TaxID=34006 RepID=A0A3D8PCL6_9RHOB|nr:gamma-glutamylcyclotransferase [Paracoccus thiocyanatus]RDW13197.1 gamma-glutamylcyclotransferase [Paracoccus thiocyanatus]
MGERPEHWVFAYGSLMWDPGFPVAEMAPATLDGYARSFCLRSIIYRGTSEAPGLVLGLHAEAGAHCRGLALRVAAPDWPRSLAGLRARELSTNAYAELSLPLMLADGRRVDAIAYVIRPDHDQYAGLLELHEQARIIAQAQGGRGPNADYLFNTARHLAQMGIEDRAMDELARLVRGRLGGAGAG